LRSVVAVALLAEGREEGDRRRDETAEVPDILSDKSCLINIVNRRSSDLE
jgi:hypothetical protein